MKLNVRKEDRRIYNARREITALNSDEVFMERFMLSTLFRAFSGMQPDRKHDIDRECGYPESFSIREYMHLYRTDGIAQRANNLYPDECWIIEPEIYEEEGDDKTPFEQGVVDLVDEQNLWHYCHRLDQISGIGQLGLMLIGLDDGMALEKPARGVLPNGMIDPNYKGRDQNVTFFRVYDQTLITVAELETDQKNPRYHQPRVYNLKTPPANLVPGSEGPSEPSDWMRVHWSRVIHFNDNNVSGDIYADPRNKSILPRLIDIRKLYAGSAEMFWGGAKPGHAFVVPPEYAAQGVDFDEDKFKRQFHQYYQGLQRFLFLKGVEPKTLAPQISSPKDHIDTQLRAIAIAKACPLRLFIGTDEAKLTSAQEKSNWNERLLRRMTKVLTPRMIRPLFDRLVALRCLRQPKEGWRKYKVVWPDVSKPTDQDKANLAITRTQAIVQYFSSGSFLLFPPMDYFVDILGLSTDQAQKIMDESPDLKNKSGLKRLTDFILKQNQPGQRPGTSTGGNGAANGTPPKSKKASSGFGAQRSSNGTNNKRFST